MLEVAAVNIALVDFHTSESRRLVRVARVREGVEHVEFRSLIRAGAAEDNLSLKEAHCALSMSRMVLNLLSVCGVGGGAAEGRLGLLGLGGGLG